MDHPHRWVFYKLSGNILFQRNNFYVPFPNVTHFGVGGTYICSQLFAKTHLWTGCSLQTSLQPLVLVGATGNSVSKRGKPKVKNVYAGNPVRQCCCSNTPPTMQKLMNPAWVQLRQDSFTTPITLVLFVHAIKQILPIKYEVMCCMLSNLKAEYIPLKRKTSQMAFACFVTVPGEKRWTENGWPSFKYVLTEHKTRVQTVCIELFPLSTMVISGQVTSLLVSPQRDRQGLWIAEDLVNISQLEKANKINSLN